MNESKLEMLSEHIVVDILNKVRDYYGREDRVGNYFKRELEEHTKEIIKMYLDH